MSDAIFIFDAETLQTLDANPAALELYGYNIDEFLDLKIQDISAYQEEPLSALTMSCNGGAEKIAFRLHKKKDGTVFPIELSPGSFSLGGRKVLFGIVKDISERKAAEISLSTSLKEKEILLKDIHHRVKNNLQIISSLLRIQSDYTNNQEIISVFEACHIRINSIALIHEQLYQSSDLNKIDFTKYVQNLADHLMTSYGVNIEKITLVNSLKDVFLTIDTAITCGLIVTELLSNALKHAFPNGRTGQIKISHNSNGNQCALTVSDTGVGVSPEIVSKFSHTMGLQLVDMLAKQLGGSLEIKVDKGTSLSLIYPQETASLDESFLMNAVLGND